MNERAVQSMNFLFFFRTKIDQFTLKVTKHYKNRLTYFRFFFKFGSTGPRADCGVASGRQRGRRWPALCNRLNGRHACDILDYKQEAWHGLWCGFSPFPFNISVFCSIWLVGRASWCDTSLMCSLLYRRYFNENLGQSIDRPVVYNSPFELVTIGRSVRPQNHANDGHPASVFGCLTPNASPDRMAVKRYFIEQIQSYRLVCSFINFVNNWMS